jgi:hypothetical protein
MSQPRVRDESLMRDPLDGNTPAAWTAVIIMLLAFVVGTLGVTIAQPWLFWVGVGILIVGAIVGKAMAMAGLGQYPKGSA